MNLGEKNYSFNNTTRQYKIHDSKNKDEDVKNPWPLQNANLI